MTGCLLSKPWLSASINRRHKIRLYAGVEQAAESQRNRGSERITILAGRSLSARRKRQHCDRRARERFANRIKLFLFERRIRMNIPRISWNCLNVPLSENIMHRVFAINVNVVANGLTAHLTLSSRNSMPVAGVRI